MLRLIKEGDLVGGGAVPPGSLESGVWSLEPLPLSLESEAWSLEPLPSGVLVPGVLVPGVLAPGLLIPGVDLVPGALAMGGALINLES